MDAIDRIFDLLDHTNMEQQEFAQLVGVSDDTASNWRRRRSASYTKFLPKISEVLNTSVEFLLYGTEKKEPTVKDDGLTDGEQALMDLFRQLTPEQQDMVIRMVQAAADKQ